MNGDATYLRPTRSGYSLIELMIVISVMILLSSLTLSRVVSSMRSAAVSRAMSDIRDVASQAQTRAGNLVMAADQAYPGVLIGKVDGRWQVALVNATAANAATVGWSDAVIDGQGRPAIHQMSPNVNLWLADTLAADSQRIAWFYEPATGRVVVASGASFSLPGAMLGYEPPAIFDSSGTALVFGARPGVSLVTVVHPPVAGVPGISFRSRDQKTKYALSVLPSGVLNLESWQ